MTIRLPRAEPPVVLPPSLESLGQAYQYEKVEEIKQHLIQLQQMNIDGFVRSSAAEAFAHDRQAVAVLVALLREIPANSLLDSLPRSNLEALREIVEAAHRVLRLLKDFDPMAQSGSSAQNVRDDIRRQLGGLHEKLFEWVRRH